MGESIKKLIPIFSMLLVILLSKEIHSSTSDIKFNRILSDTVIAPNEMLKVELNLKLYQIVYQHEIPWLPKSRKLSLDKDREDH